MNALYTNKARFFRASSLEKERERERERERDVVHGRLMYIKTATNIHKSSQQPISLGRHARQAKLIERLYFDHFTFSPHCFFTIWTALRKHWPAVA